MDRDGDWHLSVHMHSPTAPEVLRWTEMVTDLWQYAVADAAIAVASNFSTKVAGMLFPGTSDAVLAMQLLMMQVICTFG